MSFFVVQTWLQAIVDDANGIALIKETAKPIALRLVANGWADTRFAVRCSLCSRRYLVLIEPPYRDGVGHVKDRPECQNQSSVGAALRVAHLAGHRADYLTVSRRSP